MTIYLWTGSSYLSFKVHIPNGFAYKLVLANYVISKPCLKTLNVDLFPAAQHIYIYGLPSFAKSATFKSLIQLKLLSSYKSDKCFSFYGLKNICSSKAILESVHIILPFVSSL
mgnify:CR=1 FL=1